MPPEKNFYGSSLLEKFGWSPLLDAATRQATADLQVMGFNLGLTQPLVLATRVQIQLALKGFTVTYA